MRDSTVTRTTRLILAVGAILAALLSQAVAEPPIDPAYFEPTNRITGLEYPNPENATCGVLMGIKQISGSPPVNHQPSATQLPSMITGNLTLQVENFADFCYEHGFELVVEMPLTALISTAVDTIMDMPTEGSTNDTVAFTLISTLPLQAGGANSQFINTTVVASSQDFAPRHIFLNGSACNLAFAGFQPWKLPPTAPLSLPLLGPLPGLP